MTAAEEAASAKSRLEEEAKMKGNQDDELSLEGGAPLRNQFNYSDRPSQTEVLGCVEVNSKKLPTNFQERWSEACVGSITDGTTTQGELWCPSQSGRLHPFFAFAAVRPHVFVVKDIIFDFYTGDLLRAAEVRRC